MSSAGGDDDSVIDLVDSDSGEFEEGLTGSSADDAASYDSGSSLLDSHGSDSGRPAIFSPSPGYGGFYEQNRIPPTPAELCYLRCQYNPLKPSLVHAILASQPPLPPAAAAGLPMQEHRGASGLRLQCSDVPTLECNRVIPPRAATEEAFQHPVLLGSLVFPLEPWQSTGSGRSTAFQEDLNRFASAFRSGEISDGFLQVLWANKAWTAASDCRPVEDTDSGPLIPRGLPYYRSRTQRNHHLVLAACLSGPSVGSSLANSIARGRGVTNSTDGIQDLTRRIGLATLEPTDATFPVLNRLSEMSLDGLVDLSFRLVVPDGWETEVPGPHIGFGGPVGSEQKKAKRTKKKGAQSSGKGSGEASVGGVERGGSGGGWKLRVEVLMLPALTEELLVDSSKLSDEMAANPGRSRSAYVQTRGGRLVLLLQDLLLLGKGLWLGPDCDGLLNFCDPNGGLELLTEEERKVVEAHYEPMQLFSPCGATPPRSLPNKRSRVGNSDNTGAEEVGAKLILVPKPFQLPGWLFSLSQVLGTGTLPEESPPAHVPPGVCVQPKPFQLQGLEWMLRRERRGEAAGRSVIRLFPGWLQFVTAAGHVFYVLQNGWGMLLSLHFLPAPTGGTCGGFLCDEMGLGKTLECLMLVLSNPAPPGWATSTAEARAEFLGIGNKITPSEPELGASEGLVEPLPIRTTLVVVPSNLLNQWKEQINAHLQQSILKWGEYDSLSSTTLYDVVSGTTGMAAGDSPDMSSQRTRQSTRLRERESSSNSTLTRRPKFPTCRVDAEDGSTTRVPLPELDVVFTSYENLRKELAQNSPLLNFGFWRIMLDEAQLVANTNSVAAVMASQLWRRHAWVVTGTPVSSRLNEIRGLCEFLDLEPFSENSTWQRLLYNEHQIGSIAGVLSMRSLLKGVMLRRTQAAVKTQLQLPPCERVDLEVSLSKTERMFYERALHRLRKAIQALKEGNDTSSRAKNVGPRVMGALTALRQACCHPNISGGQGRIKGDTILSMLEIVGRLVAKAYSDLDSAVGSWLGQRLQAEAVAEALGDGESRGAGLNSLLVEVQDNAAFVSGINIRQQARSRQECGSIVAVDELAEQRLPKDEDDAKERWRRYKKLELQARMLHAYCIKHRWPGSGGGGPGSPIPLNSERSRKRTKRATGKGQARTIVEADPMPQEAAMRLSEQMEEEVKVRAELGMEPVSFLDKVALGEVRRSRRVPGTDGADADSKEGAFQNGGSGSRKRTHSGREAPTNEELLLRSEACIRDFLSLLSRKDPLEFAVRAVAQADAEMRKKWHSLQHALNEAEADLQEAKAAGGEAAAPGTTDAKDGDGAQENPWVCPICLDTHEYKTVTSCGHSFCTQCIHDYLSCCTYDAPAACPICRTHLSKRDLFDSVSEQQLRDLEAFANGDFGAKVSVLLTELSRIHSADPGAKSLVFSSWGRLLRLVGSCLEANGVGFASLAGCSPEARAQALWSFAHDPECRVLLMLMSHSSGAAGLTLTNASHAFIMEPALAPGLEAQAAARIYRLGQEKPTRVVRLIAKDTIEQQVLALQQFKVQAGRGKTDPGASAHEAAGDGGSSCGEAIGEVTEVLQEMDPGTLLRFFDV